MLRSVANAFHGIALSALGVFSLQLIGVIRRMHHKSVDGVFTGCFQMNRQTSNFPQLSPLIKLC